MEPEDIVAGGVTVRGDEAHHAARVLRVRRGERISAADGRGRLVEAVVADVGRTVEAEVVYERVAEPRRPLVTLFQGIAKGDRTDLAVQKAVEIGVGRIVPFFGKRSVVRWDAAKRRKAERRFTEIARAAAKQSRSPWLPALDPIEDGPEGSLEVNGLVLVLDAGASERLRCLLPPEPPAEIRLVVGPEGGLSPDEMSALEAGGGRPAALGERILRAETAGWVTAALIGYVYGDLG